uniref:Si:dkey-78l4.13 n=1 Tax=Astyanax mexicanus TaxID=7994 RepID=A0A8B9K691_ASTMX
MTLISLLLLATLVPSPTRSDVGIINGTEAKPHSRPYMVSVQRNGKHTCGGFLVSEHFVMTAAHCWNYQRISWIPIPTKDKDIKAKQACSVAGWGRQETNGSVSKRLMEVDVRVMDNKLCQKYWRTVYSALRMVTNRTCFVLQGDSGGPLVCKGTAVGIVSFTDSKSCNSPKMLPNVYTKISKFLPWINGIVGSMK